MKRSCIGVLWIRNAWRKEKVKQREKMETGYFESGEGEEVLAYREENDKKEKGMGGKYNQRKGQGIMERGTCNLEWVKRVM